MDVAIPDRALLDAGARALSAYTSQREWIQRRVESLTFPHVDERIIRRHTSFDIRCPADAPTEPAEGEKAEGVGTDGEETGRGETGREEIERRVRLVPLTLIRRWPPHFGLDLTVGKDTPLSVPSSRDADLLDAGLLVALAQKVLGAPLPRLVGYAIEDLTGLRRRSGNTADDAARESALAALIGPDERVDRGKAQQPAAATPARQPIPAAVQAQLRGDPAFLRLAGDLLVNRVLWVPLTCAANERCIVKLAYEVPFVIERDWLHASSWAWVGQKMRFDMPGVGRARSCHLDIAFPAPLVVKHARVEIVPPGGTRALANPRRQAFRPLDAEQRRLREGCVIAEEPADDVDGRLDQRHASFYIESTEEFEVDAYVNAAVEKSGYVRGALTAAVFVFATLLAYRSGFGDVVGDHRGASITVLLFVPGLLGLLVVKPGEHVLAASLLSGIRKLVVANAGWPLIAALALVLDHSDGSVPANSPLGRAWIALLAASAVTTAMLVASGYLPDDERWLDDLPRPSSVGLAIVAGTALGIWNGIATPFSLVRLGVFAAVPLLVFCVTWTVRRQRGRITLSGRTRRAFWTVACALIIAVILSGGTRLAQKAFARSSAGLEHPPTIEASGSPLLLSTKHGALLELGAVAGCPASSRGCRLVASAATPSGRTLGAQSAFVPAGHAGPVVIALKGLTRTRTLAGRATINITTIGGRRGTAEQAILVGIKSAR
jgi:hypothetical protein